MLTGATSLWSLSPMPLGTLLFPAILRYVISLACESVSLSIEVLCQLDEEVDCTVSPKPRSKPTSIL